MSGPLRRTFTYIWPDSLGNPSVGQRLVVPFGARSVTGYYLSDTNGSVTHDLKSVSRVVRGEITLDSTLFTLALWMADYYFANPADTLALAYGPQGTKTLQPLVWTGVNPSTLPPTLRRLNVAGKKVTAHARARIDAIHPQYLEELLHSGYITDESERDPGEPLHGEQGFIDPTSISHSTGARDPRKLAMTTEQSAVCAALLQSVKSGFSVHLLHGVTGSGKTLVYCHLCQEILKEGGTVLVLTPEIALALSTTNYFRAFFGKQVLAIHSGLSASERASIWNRVARKGSSIVVGPRSALFAPLPKLALIIVDEEHDGSYKQHDPAPRFHARDAAIMRAKLSGVPILLGSASPSLESYQNARTGRYVLHELKTRPVGGTLPKVDIVDMRTERIPGAYSFLSLPLKQRIESTCARNETSILFLNRRGFAGQLKCESCGQVVTCPNCHVSLTYHQSRHALQCHYCGHSTGKPSSCVTCGSGSLTLLGTGTQKVESFLATLLPGMRIERFDSDTAETREGQKTLDRFAAQTIDVLVGTQMVTKGLDFPHVTLVGVILADQMLDMPDFRSSERGFAQLLQVSGRSGRGSEPGSVLVQTWYPAHPVLAAVSSHDYHRFFHAELEKRKELAYPPFGRLVNIELSSGEEAVVERAALHFREELAERLAAQNISASILGPAPCAIYRVRGLYRRHLFLKSRTVLPVTRLLTAWEHDIPRFGLPPRVRIRIDVDPESMM